MQPSPKRKRINAHRLGMFVLMAAVILGAVLYYIPFARPHSLVNATPLLTGWSYCIEPGGVPVAVDLLDHFIPFDTHESITLTRRMTEHTDHPYLLLSLPYARAQVFLDGAPLFDNLQDPPGENPGTGVYLIALPEETMGRELTIVLTSPFSLYAYSPNPIYYGDAASLSALVVAHSARDVALLFVLLISGLLMMGVALFGVRGKWLARERWANFCFGLFAVLFGLSQATSSDLYMAIYPPILGANVEMTLWYLFPLPLMCYLWLKSVTYRRAALALAAFFWLVSLSALLGALFGLWALPAALEITNIANIVGVLAAGVLFALEAVKKNTLFRFMSPAVALLVGSAVTMAIGGLYPVKEALLLSGILLLLLLAGIDGMRSFLASHREEERERQLVEVKISLAAEQLNAAEALGEETRLLRHEIRHHLAAITVLQREGRIAEIGEYLKALNMLEQEMDAPIYCEHPLINAILCKTAADCKREGIAFTCEAQVTPDIPLSDQDLSPLLLNMLENASEAARLAPEGERWLAAQVRVKDGFLVIACRNARRGDIARHEERFVSTKANARLHGYGMIVMRKVVEKYGSKLNIDYDDVSFSVKTILPLE